MLILSYGDYSCWRVAMRNYKQEYKSYHKKPLQKKRRAQRNAARSLMIKKRGAKAVSGKDIGHKNRNKSGNLSNKVSNLSIQSKKKNRSNNQ